MYIEKLDDCPLQAAMDSHQVSLLIVHLQGADTVTRQQAEADDIWSHLSNSIKDGCLLTASTACYATENFSMFGLVNKHCYGVLDMKVLKHNDMQLPSIFSWVPGIYNTTNYSVCVQNLIHV